MDILLTPISQQLPAGTDLRLDQSTTAIYYRIKEARSFSRQLERQFLQGEISNLSRNRWDHVINDSIDALSHHSKDIELCCFLLEGLIRKHQFLGLSEGLKLLNLMVKKFWHDIYPHTDEESLEGKLSSLAALNGIDTEGTLIMPIAAIPIAQGSTHGALPLWKYKQALHFETITDLELKKKKIQENNISLKHFETALSETHTDFFHKLFEEITTSLDHLTQLKISLEKFCNQTPPLQNIANAIEEFHSHLKTLTHHKLKPPTLLDKKNISLSTTQENNFISLISNRDSALNILLTVAEYFRHHEPHSPLPYIIERTVRWGKLGLPELLNELIHSDDERKQIFHLTGIKS